MGDAESPGIPAKVIIDPSHPEAGKGGVVPPLHSRQQPGEPSINPSGKPKGSHSVRVAWKRKLRKGWETDTESDDGEQVGTLARHLADKMAEAIENGDADTIRSIATVIDQAEGKPQESTHHTGNVNAGVVILRKPIEGDNPEELPEGVD